MCVQIIVLICSSMLECVLFINIKLLHLIHTFTLYISERKMDEEAPGPKRKKVVTGNEVLALLEKHENDVRKVAKDVLEDLCPFDLSDEDAV